MPKISVIIPTYNRAKYITDAIDSVLKQTYKNYEIIIIDDGSTDNTKETLKKYKDKIVYIYKRNSGPSAARNLGILSSRGEYICFLDADDIYLHNKLEIELNEFEKDPSLDIAYSWYQWIDEYGNNMNGSTEKIDSEEIKFEDIFLFNNFFLPPAALFKRNCFDGCLFDESLTAVEDWDLMLRFSLRNYKVRSTKKFLYLYRFINDAKSVNNNIENVKENTFKVLNKVFRDGDFPDFKYDLKNQVYSNVFCEWSWRYCHRGDKENAKRYLAESIKLNPNVICNPYTYYQWTYNFIPLPKRNKEEAYKYIDKISCYMFEFLNYLFSEKDLQPYLVVRKKIAFSLAHIEIAKLSYFARDIIKARLHFLIAFSLHPSLLMDKIYLSTFLKCFLGKQIIIMCSNIRKRATFYNEKLTSNNKKILYENTSCF